KKKKDDPTQASVEQPSLSEEQQQILDLRNQLDRLERQIGSDQPTKNVSARPSIASGNMNDSDLVRGIRTPRNHSLTRSEANSKAGNQKPRRSVADIVINKDSSAGKHDQANAQWKMKGTDTERAPSIASKSVASSNRDGEVFYKDGKKYRRVVRKVQRPAASNSFRSTSSSHGIGEVTDGHVQGLVARYSMTSVTSEVSMNSRVSSASKTTAPRKSLQVRTVADTYPFLSPKQTNHRKTPHSQTDSTNPWMRNTMRQQDALKVPNEPIRPSTPAAISEWMNNQSNHVDAGTVDRSTKPNRRMGSSHGKPVSKAKKAPFQPGLFTASQTRDESRHEPPPEMKSTARQKMVSHHEPPRGMSNGKLAFRTAMESKEMLPSRDEPTKTRKGKQPAFKAMEESQGMVSSSHSPSKRSNGTSPSKNGVQRSSKIPTVKDKSPQRPVEKVTKPNHKEGKTTSAPRSWKFPFSSKPETKAPPPPSMGRSTQPVSLLDQIKKPDVTLKKLPPAAQQSHPAAPAKPVGGTGKAPGARGGPKKQFHGKGKASDPGDLLAGIRAGVALKKIDKATVPARKTQSSPMTQLLAQIQEKKAECLRREREYDPNEINW
ncbi:MAG: hypothetical protein SGILL_006364, partial [Bacillariaceae sp.]